MSSSPLAMRIRSPPRSSTPSSTTSPRTSPRTNRRGGAPHSSYWIGPSLLVRLLLPCALPLLIVSQWMIQLQSQQSQASSLNSGRQSLWTFYSSSSNNNHSADSSSDTDDGTDTEWPSQPLQIPRESTTPHFSNISSSHDGQSDRLNHVEQPPPSSSSFFKPFSKDSTRPMAVAWLAARHENDTLISYLDDALDRSKYIDLVQRIEYTIESRTWKMQPLEQQGDGATEEFSEPTVYIVDWASLERDCHVLERLFVSPSKQQPSASTSNNVQYLMYHDTTNSARIVQCPRVDQLPQFLGRVAYVKQGSIVQDRYWNHTRQWVEPGTIIPEVLLDDENVDEATTTIVRYAAPTLSQDFVNRLDNLLARRKQKSAVDSLLKRRTDICILARNASHAGYTFFRSHIAQYVIQHARTQMYSIQVLGDPSELATNDTLLEFLLDAKIVITAQPDEWQDMTGILEAMASGALVMSDALLQPPTNISGFVDKTNLLLYDNLESLTEKLDYYLQHDDKRTAIAKKGWEYSMGMQRSWQGLETLLFGSPGTHAGQPLHRARSKRHGAPDRRRNRRRR